MALTPSSKTSCPPEAALPCMSIPCEDETMFVLEGELEAVLGDQTATVKAGTFLHMARGTPTGSRT